MVIVLNRAGHAFIISQEGLPGLLNKTYANMGQLLTIELNLNFAMICTNNDHTVDELHAIQTELTAKQSKEEKLERLRQICPQEFIDY